MNRQLSVTMTRSSGKVTFPSSSNMINPTGITKSENSDENSGAGAILDSRGNDNDPVTRQEHGVLTGAFHPGMLEMTPEERAAREQEELSTSPLRVLTDSVRNGTKILINCINNKRLLCN